MNNQPEKKINILHLESNPEDAHLIQAVSKYFNIKMNVVWVDTREKFESAILNSEFDIILGAYVLRNYDGLPIIIRLVYDARNERGCLRRYGNADWTLMVLLLKRASKRD